MKFFNITVLIVFFAWAAFCEWRLLLLYRCMHSVAEQLATQNDINEDIYKKIK